MRSLSHLSKYFSAIALLGVFNSTAMANKLLILTDEQSGAKAHEIAKLIQSTLPFKLLKSSEFTIEVEVLDPKIKPIACAAKRIQYTDAEIYSLQYWSKAKGIEISAADLQKYKDGYTIDRLVECDTPTLASLGVQYQGDRMLFVHTSPYEGGSGGSIPVILSSSRSSIGLHEWLHTFGLADEYEYAQQEAPFFCAKTDWVNVAIFNDAPPYAGNDDVRIRHKDQIPWLPYLSATAALTTDGHLGSPEFGNLGIFRSRTCKLVTPELKSWKPTGYPTIMEDPFTNYIPKPYWPAVLSGLGITPDRVTALMKTTVVPGVLTYSHDGPGNPPPGI
jgi:hypothetical protein